jgi:hypothetical protein
MLNSPIIYYYGGYNEHQHAPRSPLQQAVSKPPKHLKLGGLQPKTVDAYARAIRRIGNYFDCRIDNLTSSQLLDYFTKLRIKGVRVTLIYKENIE